MKNDAGFTLIELIVTVAIAAIVLAIAVPSFQETITSNRLTTFSNTLVASLNFARSEAIKQNRRVTLCSSADGLSCATGGYQQGWIVFIDSNNNATVPNAQNVLQVSEALSGDVTLAGTSTPVQSYISYVASGVSQRIPTDTGGFQAGTLRLCKPGYTASERQIILSNGGRTRVQRIEPAATCP
jgi:type IV fimbrial biogenesis protein FimT